MGSVAYVEDSKKELVSDVDRLTRLGVCLVGSNEGGVIVQNGMKYPLFSDVKAKQDLDSILVDLKKSVFENAIEILLEAQSSRYSIHLKATKMYCNLWEVYWWNYMKKDISKFVAKCPNYQQVKVERQKLDMPLQRANTRRNAGDNVEPEVPQVESDVPCNMNNATATPNERNVRRIGS
ncbi:hypothetical protein MTR67_043950 [Solanum verrucosum]|uniref:Integrase zinc-binding domain-containing protein n=1 Tax=Solanum verrucosum TaxID=315347 RepID=A0AAF0URA1_SOLVR|nr:hypothetical protein MTR67_043950 [Solanum verrucosum]